MKERGFDVKTIIKMKVLDIKTKFMKVVILKKQIFCSEFNHKSHESSRFYY